MASRKKTIFANIAKICKQMHRQPDHIIQFLFFGYIGKANFNTIACFSSWLIKYDDIVTVEYVTCKTCKSPNTVLSKENHIYISQHASHVNQSGQ